MCFPSGPPREMRLDAALAPNLADLADRERRVALAVLAQRLAQGLGRLRGAAHEAPTSALPPLLLADARAIHAAAARVAEVRLRNSSLTAQLE